MQTTAEHITNKITHSYSKTISEQKKIDNFLDHIIEQKKVFQNITTGTEHLSKLLREMSWLDDLTNADKVLIKGVIAMGKDADKQFRQYYAQMRRKYVSKGLFKAEFAELKTAVENHKEDVSTLNYIIFELREDDTFKDLCTLVDEL